MTDIYIHGTPTGHSIYGNSSHRDYIRGFYSHVGMKGKGFLVIDICDNRSFYTYIRNEGILTIQSRPDAYFGLTVSFTGQYTTNVYKLYELLDRVYDRFVSGKILSSSGVGQEKFLISDFDTDAGSRYLLEDVIEAIRANEGGQITPFLQPLDNKNTFNCTKKCISLMEVDSPLFFEYFRNYSLIVSKNIPIASQELNKVKDALDNTTGELNRSIERSRTLESEKDDFSRQYEDLRHRYETETATATNKARRETERLQREMDELRKENADLIKNKRELETRIADITSAYHGFANAVGGTMVKKKSSVGRYNGYDDTPEKEKPKKSSSTRYRIISFILLLIAVSILCFMALKFRNLSKTVESITNSITSISDRVDEAIDSSPNVYSTSQTTTEPENTTIRSEPQGSYRIDIEGSGELKRDKSYKLRLFKGDRDATGEEGGYWEVYKDDDPKSLLDVKGHSLEIPSDIPSSTKITIVYKQNNSVVKKRDVTVK